MDCQPRTDTQVFDRLASATAYASQAEPTRRFDGTPTVLVDAAPTRLESYLKFGFNLDDGWHPKQVTLRLFATDGSSNGPLLHRASPTWQDFDWNTRPALMGDALANFGAISPGTWVEHDLTSVMTTPNMQYGFALLPDSSDGVDFASATAPVLEQRPHLRVTLESDPYCTYQGGGGGSTGWTKHYGGVGPERLGALATDAQGGFVAAGQFGDAPFPTGEGFALARYDASGTALWSRQVTTQAVTVRALTVTPEGNILAVGTYTGTPDLGMGSLTNAPYFPSLFIAKFSPTGQTVWSRGFVSNTGRTGDDFGYLSVLPESVATDAQGSLVVAGNFYGVVDFGGGPLFAGQASVGLNDAYWGGFVAKFTWRGEHVWSRALEAAVATPTARVRTVSTDAAGNVLLGGRASRLSDLGDGVLGAATPFIAKYTPSGVLVWKRLFSNAPAGEVVSLRATSTGGVAFIADVGGIFVFKDSEFSGGHDDGDPTTPQNTSPFVGALSATGSDAWLRDLYPASVQQLAVGSDDAITVSGHGDMYDLGGGVLGTSNPAGPTAFVVQYTPEGLHRWSRLFDRNFEGGPVYYPVLQLAPQPGGSVLVGTDFSTPVIFDGAMYTPRGSADLFYFQLAP
ncbi:DNRLRE domain-containing protein [Cystobacter fuscus]|uniref:DNRLRE domain-containing protein n=1 Tax=Cystobacter fuscus TaxID=43 RepID=UPI0037BEAD6C